MRIEADHDYCIGAGQCVLTAPDYFDLNANGKVSVVREDAARTDMERVNGAVLTCPAGALRVS